VGAGVVVLVACWGETCCDELLMRTSRDNIKRGNKFRFVLPSFTRHPFRFKLGLAGFCQ